MLRIRLLLVLCASTLAVAALAITLMTRGDDQDDDSDSAAALNEYFAAMSAIDDESDRQFEKTVFGVDQDSAESYAGAFDAVLAMIEAEYEKVSPPSAVEEEHEVLIAAIKDYRVGIDHGLRPLDIDAPAAEFEGLFSDVLADEDLRLSSAFCAIQEIATAEGIAADVGCQRT